MQWLITTLGEIYGLFVDDVPFAAAILVWLLIMAALLHLLPHSTHWAGVLLAAGLMALLVESAIRHARQHARHHRNGK